jgi:hypothetical protein
MLIPTQIGIVQSMDVDTMFPSSGEESFSFSHGEEEILLYANLE